MAYRADQRPYGDSFISDERAQELVDVARRHSQPWTVGPGGIEHRLGPDGQVSSLTPAKQRRELLRQAGQAPQSSSLAYALDLAQRATREHYARGGVPGFGVNPAYARMPGTTPLPAAPSARGMLPGGVQPVLSPNLQHGLLRHLLRQRPRFDDGGDAGNGGGDSGSGNDGAGNGNDNDAANNIGGVQGSYGNAATNDSSTSFGLGLGNVNVGATANMSGLGIAGVSNQVGGSMADTAGGYGIGGTGGAVGEVANAAPSSGGFDSMSIAGAPSSTMSNAAASLSGLGSLNTGFGFSPGTTATGNIGPSGIAAANGYTMGSFGGPSAGLAGFANFGAGSTDQTGLASPSDNGFMSEVAGVPGFNTLGANVNSDLGQFAVGQPSALSAALASAAASGDFAGGFTPSALGAFGAFGDLTGAASAPTSVQGSLFGSMPSFDVNPSTAQNSLAAQPGFAGSQTLANAQQSAALGNGFVGVTGVAPVAGLGTGASTDPSVTATDATAPALTVHGPIGFGNFGMTPDTTNQSFGWSPDLNAANIGNVGTPSQAGFDNFNQSDSALTAGLALNTGLNTPTVANGAYSPAGWSPMSEMNNMVTSPGDYFGSQYPALAQYSGFNTLSPGFAAGLLGNANVESAAQTAGLGLTGIVPNAMNPSTYALGAYQDLGTRKTGMLASLGINPAGMSPSEEQAALGALGVGSIVGQTGYGLNEIATDKQYDATLAAALNPNITPAQATQVIAGNFEKPGDAAIANTLAARIASANAFSSGLGAAASNPANANLGNIGGAALGATGLGAVGAPAIAAPDATTAGTYPGNATDDVRNAYAIGAAEGYDENPVTRAAALTGWNPATYSGLESLSDDDYNAEVAKINAPSTALSDAAAMDAANAQRAAAPAASTDGWGDPDTPGTLANATLGLGIDQTTGYSNMMDQAFDGMYAAELAQGQPSYVATQLAARAAGYSPISAGWGTPSNYTASADTTPIGTTDTPALTVAPGLTAADVPPRTDVTPEPGYFPSEQTAVKTIVNAGLAAGVPVLGAINAVSGALGGPSVGGWVANNSSPGTPNDPEGNASAHNSVIGPSYNYVTQGGGSTQTGLPSTSPTASSAESIAQAAYQTALKNLPGPGASARKANPVPLVAPSVVPASYYDPLSDPRVLAALSAVGSARN